MSEFIVKDEMFSMLLDACSEAATEFEEDRRDHDGLSYVQIAVFARHIIRLFEGGKTESFPEIFSTVERLIVKGDEEVQGLAIVGFLESLQNNASWTDSGLRVYEKWLGSRSLKAWKDLERLWDGKHSLAEVIRDVKA